MIRKAAIATCLLLAPALIVIDAISWRVEIVCWGADKDIKAAMVKPTYRWIWKPIRSRASFIDGSFLHLRSFRSSGMASKSEINAVAFRWLRSRANFFGATVPSWTIDTDRLIVPLWGPVALLLAYPALAFLSGALRRHRRRKKGLCQNCGYNLTGNVSGVCPECGGKVDPRSALKA
jgi:hypothetical protein